MRSPVNLVLPLAALLLAGLAQAQTSVAQGSGSAADHPVVVGEPFTIDGTTWTPADQLNYDAVGFASVQDGAAGVSGAHKTLPLPSYVEVTALDNGHTILVRLTRRGPMVNDTLIGLSPEAAAQLGLTSKSSAPVRLRRVNPPEPERSALRGGGSAPERLATPEPLLVALRRKLADQPRQLPPPSTPPSMLKGPPPPITEKPVTQDAKAVLESSLPLARKPQTQQPKPPADASRSTSLSKPPAAVLPMSRGSLMLQVGAFSKRDRAEEVARHLKGKVSVAGKLWRVRLGPFSEDRQAASALEKARAAGYSDARILRAD